MRLLFITWDGPQVSYLESLFLPIFEGLRAHRVETAVLQFGWGDAGDTAALCESRGVPYQFVPVLRRWGGAGALVSATAGARPVRRLVRSFRPDVLMPRSHMPALALLAAGGARLAPICFDADGLPAEEKVEFAGLRAGGAAHRALVAIETRAVRQARSVLVRSSFAADFLARRARVPRERFHVVRNGRDAKIFNPGTPESRLEVRTALELPLNGPVLVYAGSIGPQYRADLIAQTLAAVLRIRGDARLLLLTGSPEEARAHLQDIDAGLLEAIRIMRVRAEQVPRYLAAADVGLSFRARTLSTRAVAPVKLGEYLLCGLPVVGTAGIGDTAPAQAADVFLDEQAGPDAAAQWITGTIQPNRAAFRSAARTVGVEHFSLERSIADYARALAII